MNPGQYQQAPRPPLSEIEFGVIAEGFNLIWRNVGFFVLACLFQLLISFGISQVGSLATLGIAGKPPTPDPNDLTPYFMYTLKTSMFNIPFTILGAVLAGPFIYAFCLMTLKVIRGENLDFNDVFSGFKRIGDVLVLAFMIQVAIWIASFLCILPMYVAGGLTMFAMPIMVSTGCKPWEAVTKSVELLKKNWLMASLFFFVISLCSGLGILACCVGVLVSAPLAYVCPTLVYRDFTMGRGMVPAQPTEYPSNPEQ